MSISRMAASAALGGLVLVCAAPGARAQSWSRGEIADAVAATSDGSISGAVQDEHGVPVGGALVSVVGATRAFAVADRNGQFEVRGLSAGPYLVRAHLSGFFTSRGTTVAVRAHTRTWSSITMQPTPSKPASTETTPPPAPILAAGIGLPDSIEAPAKPDATAGGDKDPAGTDSPKDDPKDDHGELAWRLRHMRRAVLQDVDEHDRLVADAGRGDGFGQASPLMSALGSPARVATSLFAGGPFSGEVNILTTSSFDSPQQLFGSDIVARNVAYMSVGAPAGSRADWTVSGALSQADISAWVIAGTYATRGPARHHYDVGLSYATQRYDGGNPAALRDVTDGSRNAGAVYGFDTFAISPAFTVTYGTRYARYDYLEDKGLISPRVSLTLSAGRHLRINGTASRQSVAPGAEEFLPPGDTGIWLPPQRTFSSITRRSPLQAEDAAHYAVNVEHDLGSTSAVSVGAFTQYIADQLVTLFGMDMPGLPAASVGHYFVGNVGDVHAHGVAAVFRTAIAHRVRGSVEYSVTRANWSGGASGLPESIASAVLPLGADRLQDVVATIVTDVPETSTHVVVLYRVTSFRTGPADDRALDSRFDVQVRQSLPFMDFSTAKWEMLVGVRNFFREATADQSAFDELLVARPPKRLVGGLTMRF